MDSQHLGDQSGPAFSPPSCGDGESGFARCLGVGQWCAALASLALCLIIALFCYFRWPEVVAVTVFPVWAWAAVGLAVLAPSHSRSKRKRTVAILGVWALLVILFAEEPRALFTCSRSWPDPEWVAARERGIGLRVVTVNCAGGNVEVAGEALAYEPDLLLLQESPSAPELQRLLQAHPGYSLVWGYDASIIARGKLEKRSVEQDDVGFVTIAETMIHAQPIVVIDTRLLLPYCDIDLWRPAAWRDAREACLAREAQMEAIARYVGQVDRDTQLIVGGDFNTPPGDSLFRKLRPRLRDAFPEGGIGLGNTIINDIPISRIDQVWVSSHFRVHAVVARRTEHSDHRLVVCDLSLPH